MKFEISSPCSHEPTTGLYSEPDETSSHPFILFFNSSIGTLLQVVSLF
jgi:hypothetical protein